jgi:protocatechuate 3,4-dioxygenase alpha subunit
MPDNQSPDLFGQTPSQTVGPFFHYGLSWKGAADLVGNSDLGARPDLFAPEHDVLAHPRPRTKPNGQLITLGGLVLDGNGKPVPDAMIETWQADAAGYYPAAPDDGFPHFGRAATLEDGSWSIRTIRPGCVPGPGNSTQAPHIAIGVFGRGLIKRLVTRAYFADAPENENDPILALVPTTRRHTLMAQPEAALWRFDILLQGDTETVFFDV